MKKILSILALILVLTGCSAKSNEEDTIQIVSSYTIITDMLYQVGGDHIIVHNLVPSGSDPHEYEPLPNDIKKATDADIMFYNGLNLEQGEDGWFFKLANSVKKDLNKLYNLSEGIVPLYLNEGSTHAEQVNPHAYLNPNNGIIMAENIIKALVEYDPDNAADYQANGEAYLKKLNSIEEAYRVGLDSIDEASKVFVTSERAFQYMNKEYGLKEGYVWAIDTDESGSASQIKDLVNFLRNNNVKYLFVESNVDRRPMETVSKETGIPIYKTPVYSDEVGEKGSEVDTYEKLLNHNLEVILDGLK